MISDGHSYSDDLPTDEVITDAHRDAIQHDARAFAKAASPEARRAVLDRLLSSKTCGRGHAAALAGVISAGIEPRDVAEALASASTACNEVVVESVGFAPNPDASIADALLARTADRDDDVRRAAWLAYGSIAETARTSGKVDLARAIDARLAVGLATTTGEEHVLRVRAAGNAGCEACAGALAIDAQSKDATLRRAAVAAHRFLATDDAAVRMCDALERDADSRTRDFAAWALEWRATAPAVRAKCLANAATKDPSATVRLQAVRALGILSDEIDEAHEALAVLAQRDDETGDLALRTLAVHTTPPETDNEWSLASR